MLFYLIMKNADHELANVNGLTVAHFIQKYNVKLYFSKSSQDLNLKKNLQSENSEFEKILHKFSYMADAKNNADDGEKMTAIPIIQKLESSKELMVDKYNQIKESFF